MARSKEAAGLPAHWARRVLAALMVLYAVVVMGWAAVHHLVGDGLWLLALFNAFAVYLFAPLPLMALVAVLVRRRAAWAALFIVVLLFVRSFGGCLRPPSPVARAGDEGPSLTVMTYNVLYTHANAAPAAASIARADPDLIAFQELTPELAEGLERAIGDRYPYRTPLRPNECGVEVAIWSRYPLRIEAVSEDVLCRERWVVVDLDGHPVRVVNVHAWPYTGLDRESIKQGFRWREAQVADILGRLEGQPEPLVLLGDLNSTPMHEVYQELAVRLADAYEEAGWGLGHTFPTTNQRLGGVALPDRVLRIDYVFHSHHWMAVDAWVGEWDGISDHRPVLATLSLSSGD